MNEKFYIEDYSTCKHHQYKKQMTNDTVCYSYSNFSSNSSSTINFMDACNTPLQQFNFQQNSHKSVSVQEIDILAWEGRIMSDVEKNIKMFDKVKTIEISSKNLSSANYYNNIDLTIPDLYRQSASKNVHHFNKIENEWYYNQNSCSQHIGHASCAQEKLYNIKKNQDVDFVSRNSNYIDELQENMFCITDNKNAPNETVPAYNYYDKFIDNQPFIQSDNFSINTRPTFVPVRNSIDQQTEGSNEESDVVVEESDEEIIDYEDAGKQLHPTSTCLICNTTYRPLGKQFYFLTEKVHLLCSLKNQ